MKIQDSCFVALNYTLTLESGEQIEQSDEGQPLTFLYNTGQMIPGLEKGLAGMEQGQRSRIAVEPEDGYGLRRDDLLQEIPRDHFPGDVAIEPGMAFMAHGPHGAMRITVAEVKDGLVVADLNHPLAGQRLFFDVEVVEVREATEDELDSCHSGGSCGSGGGCGSGCCGGCG